MLNVLCAAVLASSILSTSAFAGNLLDLAVIDRDSGATLPTYAAGGKLYVAGTPGHRYSVRLSNRSGGRVLAVLSVDGVNAVSGQTANPDQTGYVLGAWESTEINGWRKNLDEVAQFNFTALPNSYAARTGRPANVGVIGVAVFTERVRYWRGRDRIANDASATSPASAPAATREQSNSADAAKAASPPPARSKASTRTSGEAIAQREVRLGTGHGARELAHVDTTAFERASRQPAEVLAIWYDSYANLAAQGIVAWPIAERSPSPFPGPFVPDPPPR